MGDLGGLILRPGRIPASSARGGRAQLEAEPGIAAAAIAAVLFTEHFERTCSSP
jgi:hypothetical protein